MLSRPQGNVSVWIHAKDAAGNWGAPEAFTLQLDKTNPVIASQPVDVVASHQYPTQNEDGLNVLTIGSITLTACDPNGVTADPVCPLPTGTALLTAPNTPVSQLVIDPAAVGDKHVQIRYHVSAVQGQIGVAGAGIFYQTAQSALGTASDTDGDGVWDISFDWHFVEQPPLPPEAATSVWVWVLDEAGNPSIPVEVPVGPPTQP